MASGLWTGLLPAGATPLLVPPVDRTSEANLQLLLQERPERDPCRDELLRNKRGTSEAGERVELEEPDPIVSRDQVAARVAIAAESRVGFESSPLSLCGDRGRKVSRADLPSALAEVLTLVVEGVAGIDLDLQAGEGEWPGAAVNDANGDLASGEE